MFIPFMISDPSIISSMNYMGEREGGGKEREREGGKEGGREEEREGRRVGGRKRGRRKQRKTDES